jgi:[CysO sulfur-carrier protein]-S-L-cysteine hydrolase
MPLELILNDDLFIQVNEYARACLPLEGCGLLAGNGSSAQSFLPITNELKSPTAFRMAAQEQLDAFLWMEAQSMDLLAIFHTHPNSPQTPSPTDLAEFFYPGTPMIIWTPFSLRAFSVEKNGFTEIPVILNRE